MLTSELAKRVRSSAMGVLGINHIAFRSPEPDALRAFYLQLTAAESLEGEHDPIRVGQTLLVFFAAGEADGVGGDEIAFDVDRDGFEHVLEQARALDVLERGPVQHTPWSQGVYARDPDGRRLEFTYDDRSVYWR